MENKKEHFQTLLGPWPPHPLKGQDVGGGQRNRFGGDKTQPGPQRGCHDLKGTLLKWFSPKGRSGHAVPPALSVSNWKMVILDWSFPLP